MKVALLGTGFGQAHAAVYRDRPDVNELVVFGRTPSTLAKIADEFGVATTTDLDGLVCDPSVDLVDICLPTTLHADIAVRAMEAGKNVLIELPLAATPAEAQRVVAAQRATGRRAFVDMFSRFDPARRLLCEAVADQRYGPLRALEVEARTALLWEGYPLDLTSIALDMMHSDLDLITGVLGRPDTVYVSGTDGPGGHGSAADVLLWFPAAIARCSSSALMPQPYQVRGGWRATFTGTVLEYTTHAGWTGQGSATLVEHTDGGKRVLELPETNPYAEMIDHVLACLHGTTDTLIDPASALDALTLTHQVHQALTAPRG